MPEGPGAGSPRFAEVRAVAAFRCSLLVLAVVVASCGSPSPPERRDLVIGIVGEPASLFADDDGARVIAGAVIAPLVQRDAREEFEPRLAEAVPTLQNGGLAIDDSEGAGPGGRLAATFRLRGGLRWHDGAPITAADVRFAHEQGRAAPIGSEARYLADRIERVEVLDERTARVLYRAGERWENHPLAPRALPRHLLLDATPQARSAYERQPVHAGPFRISSWTPGRSVSLSAFDEYALGKPALDRIEIRFFADRTAVLAALRSGDVDVAPSPTLDADLARTLDRFGPDSGMQVIYTAAQSVEMLRFGRRMDDPALRRAVALAVDRLRVVHSVFSGRPRVPSSYLVAPLWAATEAPAQARPDREAARALLASSGFRRGAFGIIERDGDRFIVTLSVASGSPARVESARLIAGDLAGIGIAAEIRQRPLAEITSGLASGAVDIALVPETAADAQAATERYLGLVDPWFDVLAEAAVAAPARAEKRRLYAELQRLWWDELPALPIHQRLRVDVVPTRLLGVQATAHDAPLTWNVGTWRFRAP